MGNGIFITLIKRKLIQRIHVGPSRGKIFANTIHFQIEQAQPIKKLLCNHQR